MTNAPPPPAWSDRQQVAVAEIGPPGGFWIRFVAYLLDALVLSIATAIIVGAIVISKRRSTSISAGGTEAKTPADQVTA